MTERKLMLHQQPCANCDHPRYEHKFNGAPWFGTMKWETCRHNGCICELYVEEPTESEANRAA